jgi:phosphoenolpyruvate synthase/pyruvate phosphate dikinase
VNTSIPLSAPEAADASRVGPKAANLAALGHAGAADPDGFCLVADAYRHQIAELGLRKRRATFLPSRGSRRGAMRST